MVSNLPLEDIYYLSILFKSMKGLFEIKLLDPLDEDFNFIHEIISQNPNPQNQAHSSILQNRFIEILNLNFLVNPIEIKEKIQFLIETNDESKSSNNTDNKFITSDLNKTLFEEKNNTNTKPPSSFEESLNTLSSNYENNHFYIKDLHKKDTPLVRPKNYFNVHEKNNFLKSVKLSVEFFKENDRDIQKNIYFDNMENSFNENNNSNKFLQITDFSTKICSINITNLDQNIAQTIKNQAHIIANNRIEELVPFAVVGYHFKESDKKNLTRRKKKKKKVLFKKDIKYLK